MNFDAVIEKIQGEESYRSFAYDDATGDPIVPGYTMKGHPTIWWGLCVEKDRIPALGSVPDEVLRYVLWDRWLTLASKLPWLDEQLEDVQNVVLEMSYQLGVEGVLEFKLMLAAIQRGDLETAAENIRGSKFHAQTTARAERLATQLEEAA